jgi:hypothetical protein
VDRIEKALTDTFEWIYREQGPSAGIVKWDSFVAWLQSETDLYWIAGKAGSGKSTLMKFLHSDPRTEKHLQVWAQDSKLVITGHFFWNSGDSIQMSVDGLIRTLLHGIGEQMPDILSTLFAERWAEMEIISDLELATLQPWTSSECVQALRRFMTHSLQGFRFLFFVDGLDECSGELMQLTGLLTEMAASPHIKMCLASRPWSVFQDAFNRNPSLMLQHLTYRDIEIYVRSKFYEHRGFQELEIGNSKLAASLCANISEKGLGVFLWVRLVVQSLLRGITNGDRVVDLMRRLDDLPDDLELLFRKILDSVDPVYREHSAQIFQIHHTASKYGGINILRFSYADEEDKALWDEEPTSLEREEYTFRVKSMARRLDSRTKGLLETTSPFLDEMKDK